MKSADIVICGGGLIGTVLANALGKQPILRRTSVVVLESAKSATPKKTNVRRVVALNPASQSLLQDLGLWSRLSPTPIHHIKVWGPTVDSESLTFTDPHPLAYIVANDDLVDAAVQGLSEYNNVTVQYGAVVKDVVIPADSRQPAVVSTDQGDISCKLLVGADGVNSLVRRKLNPSYLSWDYKQTAIIATLNISQGGTEKNDTAWQKFLPTGPVAILPVSPTVSSLVWTNSTEKATRLMQCSDEAFTDALNDALTKPQAESPLSREVLQALGRWLPGDQGTRSCGLLAPYVESVEAGSRASFPLGFGHSASYVASRTVIIGDASHRVHPLAGAGLNLGLGDVRTLAATLGRSALDGRPLACPVALRSFEATAQRAKIPMFSAIELLHRLFATPAAPGLFLGQLALRLAAPARPALQAIAQGGLFS